MIIQIEQLFINTDNIVTIHPFDRLVTDKEEKEYIETGISINGIKYTLSIVEKEKTEDINKAKQKTINVITTVINNMSVHAVQKLNLGEKDE